MTRVSTKRIQKYFAIACLLLMGKDWSQLERFWKLRLDSVNKKLKKQHRRTISRYHTHRTAVAGARNSRAGTHDERDEFVKDLFQVFKHVAVLSECFDMRLDDLCEVFPEFSADPLRGAYLVSVRAIIELLGQDFYRLSKIRGDDSVRITLFHDRTSNGKYDPVILRAFNQVVLSTWFKFREYFTTIAPMPWERCIALQPADLVAFEACKEAEARAEPAPSRKSFLALVDMKDFGIRLMTFSTLECKRCDGTWNDGARYRRFWTRLILPRSQKLCHRSRTSLTPVAPSFACFSRRVGGCRCLRPILFPQPSTEKSDFL